MNHLPSLLRWSCLQTKEGQKRNKFHLVGLEDSETPSTSAVWPSDHRKDDMYCAWPLYSLVQIFSVALWTNKTVGTIWKALSKPHQRWRGPDLIASRDSFSLLTWARVQTARSTDYFNGYPFIFFDILLYYQNNYESNVKKINIKKWKHHCVTKL